jgi:crotonobetainyl-CoA:carnitine CoA-transferase CaiB-like acyl-CoA transferase
MDSPVKNGSLEGVIVIDLTMMLAGPYCTMVLGDQGATIIKVEPIENGDMTRQLNISKTSMPFGGYHQSINRNKLSIAIDLKTSEGAEMIRRLAKDADEIVENYRVGVMDRLGLSYESLHKINPKLIYAAVRGFGDPRTGQSPYAQWPSFDVVAQAMGGITGITGINRDTPIKIGPGVGDIVPALFSAVGILSALHHAQKTGEGQFVVVAMYDGVLALCERIVHQYSVSGVIAEPEGNSHPLLCPFGIFPAKDGWISIACPKDHFWIDLLNCMERKDLIDHPDYSTNLARIQNSKKTIELVSDWTKNLTKKELTARLGGLLPFGPVNRVDEIFSDPHTKIRDMLPTVEQPDFGNIQITGTPIRMTKTQGGVSRRAAFLGEDTDEILLYAGYSSNEIAFFKKNNIIK